MQATPRVSAASPVRIGLFLIYLTLLTVSAVSSAQSPSENSRYTRANTLGVLVAYSNDSSAMVLGITQNRKLLEVGVSYDRRLLSNRAVNWQYSAEILPVVLESDPIQEVVISSSSPPPFNLTSNYPTTSACQPASGSGPGYTFTATCSRRWTMGEGISPVGFQWNFLTRRRLEPFLIGHGGYMYSTQEIPVSGAGNFNFTFDFGAGIEFFRTHSQSVRAEYRYHHISNDWTARQNPGIDNGVFQVSYAFGR